MNTDACVAAKRVGAVALMLLLSAGCAGISSPRTEFELPAQDFTAEPPEGIARVIFYNGPEGGTQVDGADKVNIYVDDRAVAGLRKWHYVVVDLEPGEYEVRLVHSDLANFRSGHVMIVDAGLNWVKVHSTLTANRLVQMEVAQPNFESFWWPAPIRR